MSWPAGQYLYLKCYKDRCLSVKISWNSGRKLWYNIICKCFLMFLVDTQFYLHCSCCLLKLQRSSVSVPCLSLRWCCVAYCLAHFSFPLPVLALNVAWRLGVLMWCPSSIWLDLVLCQPNASANHCVLISSVKIIMFFLSWKIYQAILRAIILCRFAFSGMLLLDSVSVIALAIACLLLSLGVL